MRHILYLILSHHTVMRPCHCSNTALSQMGPYMVFHIFRQHDHRARLYLRLCSHGQLFYYFRGCHIYEFASAFTDVLITNPPYVILGESYHIQILIDPD